MFKVSMRPTNNTELSSSLPFLSLLLLTFGIYTVNGTVCLRVGAKLRSKGLLGSIPEAAYPLIHWV